MTLSHGLMIQTGDDLDSSNNTPPATRTSTGLMKASDGGSTFATYLVWRHPNARHLRGARVLITSDAFTDTGILISSMPGQSRIQRLEPPSFSLSQIQIRQPGYEYLGLMPAVVETEHCHTILESQSLFHRLEHHPILINSLTGRCIVGAAGSYNDRTSSGKEHGLCEDPLKTADLIM